jgi:hypothetical protein
VKQYCNTPDGKVLILTRQPLLWAALAFAAGIFLGSYLWRPALWWLIAGFFFIFSGVYYLQRRVWTASALGLSTLIAAGAFCIQVRPPADIGNLNILQFAGGREVILTAHVIKEGIVRSESFGTTRRSLDVETEQVESNGDIFRIRAGLRVSFYSKEEDDEDSKDADTPAFQYNKPPALPHETLRTTQLRQSRGIRLSGISCRQWDRGPRLG